MFDLDQQLEVWLDEGIISPAQAEQMRRSPLVLTSATAKDRRIPIFTEILGYVGAALAIWSAGFLVSEVWENLAGWPQVALFALLSGLLFAGGAVLAGTPEAALMRLSSVLWAGSVASWSATVFLLFNEVVGWRGETATLVAGLGGAALAAFLLYRQATVLQHVALFTTSMMAVTAILGLMEGEEGSYYGLIVWGFGAVWLLLTRYEVLRPQLPGMILGTVALLLGAQMTMDISEFATLGTLFGLATAAIMAGFGIVLRDRLTVILGSVGIFWFVPQAMFHFFGEEGGALLGIFVVGVAIVGIAVWLGRHREAV